MKLEPTFLLLLRLSQCGDKGRMRRRAAALEMRYVTAAKAEGGEKERGTVRRPRCVCLFVLGLHYGRRGKVRSLVRTLGQVMQQKRGKMGGEGSTISLKRLLAYYVMQARREKRNVPLSHPKKSCYF